MTETYKHEENQLDPRDKNLVSYTPGKKLFVAEASDLHGSGIEPAWHKGIFSYYYIWLWSEKLQTSILYKHNRTVRGPEHDVIADVFVPYFTMITTDSEMKARELSEGTELHILND
jgi:hypothetical protein